MTRCAARRTSWFLAAATLLSGLACTDGGTPTAPTATRADVSTLAGGNGGGGGGGGGGGQHRLTIVGLNLSAGTLAIDGPAVPYNITIQNKGGAVSGVVVQGTIVQGTVTHAAGGYSASCPPNPPGVVPQGSCTMTLSASASNAVGTGTLVPGSATFVATLYLTSGGASTAVDQSSVPVTLVSSAPKISSVTLTSTTLTIDGANPTPYTVVIQNPGNPLSGVSIEGHVVQGTVDHGAGAVTTACSDPTNSDGILPTGSCSMTYSVSASNSPGAGSGSLVPGAATFVLKLVQTVSGTPTVLDSKSTPVTLVAASPPTITSLSVSPSTVIIDGPAATWTATFSNTNAPLFGILAQGYIVVGTDTVPANGTSVNCPPNGLGVLPQGTCTMSSSMAAQTSAINGNKLVPGSATFLLELFQSANNTTTLLATKTFPITLAANTPTITSVVFDASVPRRSDDGTVILLIDPNTNEGYTATIDNPGPSLTGILIQAEIHQGTVVHGAGGASISCQNISPVPADGTLPTGTCTMQYTTLASNATAGNGDLVEGYADWVLYLANASGNITSYTVRVYLAQQQF